MTTANFHNDPPFFSPPFGFACCSSSTSSARRRLDQPRAPVAHLRREIRRDCLADARPLGWPPRRSVNKSDPIESESGTWHRKWEAGLNANTILPVRVAFLVLSQATSGALPLGFLTATATLRAGFETASFIFTSSVF